MTMFRKGALFSAALCTALGFSLPVSAQVKYYAYEPHYLPGVEDASNQVKFFSPHFAPMEVLKKWGGTSVGLTRGYSLLSADVNQLGINLSFSKSGVDQKTQYFWSWGGGYVAPVSTPYKDDVVVSIVYADIKFFEIWNYLHMKGTPATWCVVPNGTVLDHNDMVCVVTERDAQGLVDALATLVVASGGNLEPSPGMYMRAKQGKELEKHPEQACRVSWLHTVGPPTSAGVQVGDLVQTIGGKPCSGEGDFKDALKKAASGNGVVHLEVLRKGQSLAFDLHYANQEATIAQLRQKSAVAGRHPVGSVVANPEVSQAAPPSVQRFGFQVRAVMDSDVIPLRLSKPKGIVVVMVDKGGLAEGMGIRSGDVILEVNDSEIGDLQFFSQFVRSGAAKSFRIWREGQTITVVVPESM